MPDKISLSLIGAASAETPQGEAVTARKSLAVLAILAVSETQPVPREFLAATIWSAVEDARARASLRQNLTEIRNVSPLFDAVLDGSRQAIAMRFEHVDCDVLRLFRAAELGDIAGLRLIPANLGTQLLYGFEDLGENFADWLTALRATIVERLADTLQRGFDDPDLTADQKRALAEACLRLNPLNERAARVAMRAMADDGELAQALLLYKRLYDLMDDEWGMPLSEETQMLAVEIKQNQSTVEDTYTSPPLTPARVVGTYGQPVLAVLPMKVFGQDSEAAQIGEMFVEDIVCSLAACRELPTLSNATTRTMGASEDPVGHLRDHHGVTYALQTTLRRGADKNRVTTQLVGSESGLTIWGQSFNPTDDDLFGVQAEIASKVVSALVPHIHAAEFQAAEHFHMSDLNAYQMLLKARHLTYSLDRTNLLEAQDLLTTCSDSYPGFAQAYLGLAEVHSIQIGQSWSQDSAGDTGRIKAALGEALRLNPRDARAMAMMGHNMGIYERAYEPATTAFRQAIDALPNDAETLVWSAPVLSYANEHDTATENAEKAIGLSPEDPMMFRFEHFVSIAHFAAGRHERAAHYGLRSMERNPRYTSNLRVTMGALAALGRHDDITELRKLHNDINPSFRIRDFVNWQAFETPQRRTEFGRLLAEAGLQD